MQFEGVCAKIYKPCTFMECTLFAEKNEEVSVAMSNHNEKYEKLASVIEEHKSQKGGLMPVLQEAQAIFGCVPVDVQEIIADGLGKTLSEVYGVATFYSQFSLEPKASMCAAFALALPATSRVLRKCWTSWWKNFRSTWAAPRRTASSPFRRPAALARVVWPRS